MPGYFVTAARRAHSTDTALMTLMTIKEGIVTARHTTINRKGQITIPVETRRALKLEAGDRITIELRGDSVIVRRAKSVAAQTAGFLAAYRRPEPLTTEEERAAFENAVADSMDS
jgi:AbrB family looped-hinge helix DNA binding protein